MSELKLSIRKHGSLVLLRSSLAASEINTEDFADAGARIHVCFSALAPLKGFCTLYGKNGKSKVISSHN